MEGVFVRILNMSITAGWLILAVIAARFLLKRAPRKVTVLLWGLVAVRLILPFSIESPTSLVPSVEVLGQAAASFGASEPVPGGLPGGLSQAAASSEAAKSGRGKLGLQGSSVGSEPVREGRSGGAEMMKSRSGSSDVKMASGTSEPVPGGPEFVNNLTNSKRFLSPIMLLGMVALLGYAFVGVLRLRLKTREAVRLRENVWVCDQVEMPFVLGIFRPRIYLPSGFGEPDEHVLAHERAHIAGRDPLWKALGFLLLSVYWFHPLVWVAYVLFCRDIEAACDERVIRDMDLAGRKAYAHALVTCGRQQRAMLVCPLAFGEVGVKERVKGVLNYKKPGFWIVIAAFAVCAVVAVCFATNPVKKEETPSVRVLKVKMEDLKGVVTALRENGYTASMWFADGMAETKVGWYYDFQLEEFLANAEWEACGPAKCLTDEEHLLLSNEKFSLAVYKDLQFACLQMNGQTKSYQIGAKDYETLRELFHPYSEENAAAVSHDYVELYAPYVGDASKVSRIAGSLNYPDGYTYNSIKIWSQTEPYGLDVYLNGAFVSDGEVLPEAVTNALHTCAEAAFASIGNLGSVRFYAVDEYGQKWFLYKQDRQGEEVLEGSFAFGEQRGSVLTLEKEGTVDRFSYSYDMLSSYWPHGTVTRKGDRLVCRTDDGEFQYTFTIKDENTLLFDAKNSSAIEYADLQVNIDPPVEDGSMYLRISIPQGTFASEQEPQYLFQLFEDGRFLYSHKLLDSFGVNGTAVCSGDRLVCRDDRGEYEFSFNIMDENTLVLDGKNSTLTGSSAGQMPLMDGDTFLRVPGGQA